MARCRVWCDSATLSCEWRPSRSVRNLERAGVPRSVAMKITGHRTEAVYRRYAIVSEAELRGASMKLAGTITGTVGPSRPSPRDVSMRS